jgi:hypothetical protein
MGHYVYILFRETGVPFYVGAGTGKRWQQHYGPSARVPRDVVAYDIRRRGFEMPRVKVAEDLSRPEAYAIQRALIAAIGREPDGPLVNATDGGDDGPGFTPEQRAKIAEAKRGIKLKPSHKAKISAGNKRAYADGVRGVTGMTGKTHMPETIEKMRASALARVTDEQRERMKRIRWTAGRYAAFRSDES